LVMLNSFLRRPILTHIQSFLSPSSIDSFDCSILQTILW
jgi:hypothetical protein